MLRVQPAHNAEGVVEEGAQTLLPPELLCVLILLQGAGDWRRAVRNSRQQTHLPRGLLDRQGRNR